MEDYDECEHEGACEVPTAKFSGWDLWIALFGMLTGIFHAISAGFESLLQASVMAANKEIQDRNFHESAALDIERIVSGE